MMSKKMFLTNHHSYEKFIHLNVIKISWGKYSFIMSQLIFIIAV